MVSRAPFRLAALVAVAAAAVLTAALLGARGASTGTGAPVGVTSAVPGPLAAAPEVAPGAPTPSPVVVRDEVQPSSTEPPGDPSSFAALAVGAEAVAATVVAGDGVVEAWAERPPGPGGPPPTWTIPVVNEFGGPAHFRVLDQREAWLLVQLPVRPNGSQGWIRAEQVTLARVGHRVEVVLGQRVLRVFEQGALVLEAPVAVGRPDAVTPVGEFYLRDSFAWDPSSVYGPYVLPLSAFSESIDVINGGEAVIAIHGTNRPEALGRAASLGCIRVDNETVTQLAHLLPPGTPVTIVA